MERTLEEMEAQRVPAASAGRCRYLAAVGARMIQCSDLNPFDAARPAGIVISERTARLFGRGLHIGRLVDWHVNSKVVIPLQGVGIVNDVRDDEADREPLAHVFVDYRDGLKMSEQIGDTPIMGPIDPRTRTLAPFLKRSPEMMAFLQCEATTSDRDRALRAIVCDDQGRP